MIRMPELSTRDRRALILGLGLVLPAIVWMFAVAPFAHRLDAARERLDAERELLLRERELLSRSAGYPAALDAAAGRLLEVAPRLFGGGNAGVASAMLAQHLQTAARSNRVLLTRLEPAGSGEPEAGLLALTLDVRGETDLEGLLSMMSALESGAKVVRIEDLRISGLRAASAAAGASEGPQVLSFQFRARGFMIAGPDEDAGRAAGPAEAGPSARRREGGA